ncbi:glycoside hydrolase family 16 protein [Hydnum rufescens UP504]|uniref:Glycoside hydrolase family 16 protein n=1 Tax=Hydnum rufescens UP504 TaxID=1448309 RepID=A0A9P6E0M0_9AGAM|nr:glycoside hydrolase family 16 protein [Hydnum rufescens UP504]
MLSYISAVSLGFVLGFVRLVGAHPYTVHDTYIGGSFYNGFTAQAISDPTNGRVNYVDTPTAQGLNLTYASSDTFILRTDFTSFLDPNGPGRDSVRLISNNVYTTSVIVADIRHMPQGCATWPALWTVANPWPNLGEIDIIEGVNDQSPNQATLHTTPGCTQPANRAQTGKSVSNDCNTYVNNNVGCGVRSTLSNSYGPSFNSNGGGWYAMERTSSSITVWFWPRGSGPPSNVANGENFIDTSTWGEPMALFVNDSCDIASKFGPHNILINLTLCGTWAGQPSVYSSAGCPGSCVDHVNNNPSAFTNAYFEFASLRVYT